jgi:hypothetical protein
MNRTMVTHLAYPKDTSDTEASGLLVTLFGEEGLDDQQFYVAREEAEDLIQMIADGLDIDLAEVAW